MQEKSTWESFFDAHASLYEENVCTKNTLAEVDFLLDVLDLPDGASVLDVGCGTGRHSVELARRGFSVTGLDLSSEMLARRLRLLAQGARGQHGHEGQSRRHAKGRLPLRRNDWDARY